MVATRWVNIIKVGDTYESRNVVRGWSQVSRIDCGGTFAPVGRLQSIRMTLVIAVKLDYDVFMLFINRRPADINERLHGEKHFIKMPTGYKIGNQSGIPWI